METIAVLRGGPGDGRVMAVRDPWRPILMQELAEDPREFWTKTPEQMIEPVSVRTISYEATRAVIEYHVTGVR